MIRNVVLFAALTASCSCSKGFPTPPRVQERIPCENGRARTGRAMKLTKDMFDFEKYDYRFGYPSIKDEALFSGGSQWVKPDNNAHQGLLRTPKPKPRYILLNEGEKLQAGDQQAYMYNGKLYWDGALRCVGQGAVVLASDIWRRKVQE